MSEQDRTCGTCKRYDPACAYCSLWGLRTEAVGRCTEWGEKKAERKADKPTARKGAAMEGRT